VSLPSPVEALTRRAGAVIPKHRAVASHYGSTAGELAVCVQAVGLADRSDLVQLELSGASAPLAELVAACCGSLLVGGGCAFSDGAWWGAASSKRVLVLASPPSGPLMEAIRERASAEIELTERSGEWAAMALVGRATLAVLSELGVVDDVRAATPFAVTAVRGTVVELLLESDSRALLLVHRDGAAEVWKAAEAAGREFGLSYVGVQAIGRYALLERLVERAALSAAG
jgi:glycine cleavage system aminomethyltransferase T